MEYKWGHRLVPIDANIVGKELERIRSLTGKLKPVTVVEKAKPKRSPIHKAFEWDDGVAGEKYRVHQARNLIRAVRVVVDDGPEETVTRPQFVHIPEKDPYYQSTEIAVENIDEFVLAVEGLAGKVAGAQRALSDLQAMVDGDKTGTAALLSIVASALATARETIARVN